jgi:hypothetical protein
MVTSAAQELVNFLLRTNEAVPIEQGATALLESIAGHSPISADVSVAPADQLTGEERVLLGAPVLADVHRREGLLLCTPDLPAAHVTALVVTHRVPEPAHRALGITPAGQIQRTPQNEHARMPLGRALRGLGVTREQLSATATPFHLNEEGSEIAVLSVARLWTPSGWPLALVMERVHAQFLDAYPPPWPLAYTRAKAN